jgi:hypothetical protein
MRLSPAVGTAPAPSPTPATPLPYDPRPHSPARDAPRRRGTLRWSRTEVAPSTWARPVGLLLALIVVGLLLAPVAALAHPFGPPPRAWVTTDGTTVEIGWEAAYDDHLAVGEHLGYFEQGTSEAYVDPNVQVAPPRADEEALAASEELRDYLESHIGVFQNGQRCAPQVLSTEAFVDRGARTRHECHDREAPLTLRVTVLHDIHDAYRTFGLADDGNAGPFAVFSVDDPEHAVTFGELEGDSTSSSRLVLIGSVVVVAVGTVTAVRMLTGGERRP